MKHNHSLSLTRASELQQKIQLLASIEPSDAPLMSCYLNAGNGRQSCTAYFDEQARKLRQSLPASAHSDFDHAVDMIRRGLEEMPSETRGIALFARGKGGGRFFMSIPLPVAVRDGLAYHRVPDVYPLIELSESYRPCLLVLIRRTWLQVSEVESGTASVLLWSALPRALSNTDRDSLEHVPRSVFENANLDRQIRLVERFLRARRGLPVILAGDPDLTEQLRSRLPQSLRTRLVDVLPTAEHRDSQTVASASLASFQRYQRENARAVSARLLRELHAGRSSVVGMSASLNALRNYKAATLVLGRSTDDELEWSHPAERIARMQAKPSDSHPAFGESDMQALEPRAELLRLAIQQGVTVKLVPSDHELQLLGGVGCLLRGHSEACAAHRPDRADRLRLVA